MRPSPLLVAVAFFLLPNALGRNSHRSLDKNLYRHRRVSSTHNNVTDYQDNEAAGLVKRGDTKYVLMHHVRYLKLVVNEKADLVSRW